MDVLAQYLTLLECGDDCGNFDHFEQRSWMQELLQEIQTSIQAGKDPLEEEEYSIAGGAGLCLSGVAAFGAYVSLNGCAVVVGWQFALTGSYGGGVGSPNLSLNGGLMVTNASTPEDLSGEFMNVGAGAALAVGVSDE